MLDEKSLNDYLVESNFRGRIEKTIEGNAGYVYILDNGENVAPRRIAIKSINLHRKNKEVGSEEIKRFKREVEQWYKYRHNELILTPFIIKIIQNIPFIAMPYCDCDLREYMKNENSFTDCLIVSIQICHALNYARTKGLVSHQDLKPENILLQDLHRMYVEKYPFRWKVQLSDFGLANAFQEIGLRNGSRPYMAPEQYNSSSDLSKVDVFAVGVILHELFTGYHPIEEKTLDVWPNPLAVKGNKWKHEKVWKIWSQEKNKNCSRINDEALRLVIESMISSEAELRPYLVDVEKRLINMLKNIDDYLFRTIEMYLNYFDEIATTSENEDEKIHDSYAEKQISQFSKILMK